MFFFCWIFDLNTELRYFRHNIGVNSEFTLHRLCDVYADAIKGILNDFRKGKKEYRLWRRRAIGALPWAVHVRVRVLDVFGETDSIASSAAIRNPTLPPDRQRQSTAVFRIRSTAVFRIRSEKNRQTRRTVCSRVKLLSVSTVRTQPPSVSRPALFVNQRRRTICVFRTRISDTRVSTQQCCLCANVTAVRSCDCNTDAKKKKRKKISHRTPVGGNTYSGLRSARNGRRFFSFNFLSRIINEESVFDLIFSNFRYPEVEIIFGIPDVFIRSTL